MATAAGVGAVATGIRAWLAARGRALATTFRLKHLTPVLIAGGVIASAIRL